MGIVTITDYSTWLSSVGLSAITPNQAALDYAIEEARAACGRSFTYSPADGGADEARTFAGSGEPTIVIDDLLTCSAISYTGADLGTAAMATGTYTLEAAGSSPYIYLVRQRSLALSGYVDNRRYIAPGVWPEASTITITGQWGYAATTPKPVVEAICMLAAVRLLSGGDWTNAGIKRTQVLNVTVDFAQGNSLEAKVVEAKGKLRDFARIEKEPHL